LDQKAVKPVEHYFFVERKPEWLKIRPPSGEKYLFIKKLKEGLELHTVCEEAHCPNIYECWGGGTATFMLLGDTCTRHCRFCAVKSGKPNGYLDPFEPIKVAYAIRQMGLKYAVITSVDRDDLEDGGASHFARTIKEVKRLSPETLIEVLIPDFKGDLNAVKTVVEAKPDVIAHNVETVRRLTPYVRDPRANFDQSLNVLRAVKRFDQAIYTKSSIMLGLGEEKEEVISAMRELREANVDFLTIGQYLRPSRAHLPVKEYVHPLTFEEYKRIAEDMGFKYVAAGPLVRSSYRAGEFFISAIIRQKSVTGGARL
jgi:lipoic acid synthetase